MFSENMLYVSLHQILFLCYSSVSPPSSHLIQDFQLLIESSISFCYSPLDLTEVDLMDLHEQQFHTNLTLTNSLCVDLSKRDLNVLWGVQSKSSFLAYFICQSQLSHTYYSFSLKVARNIDLVYGGGSIGLMGLISQAVYDGGRHVIG